MAKEKHDPNLEGRLILLAGHGLSAKKTADDIAKHFNEDHQMSRRIVRLDSLRLPYKGGRQNFHIVDPSRNYSYDQIEYMIRHGDTYIVTKLENPFFADPMKSLLDGILDTLGREYFNLNKEFNKIEEVEEKFTSFTSTKLPVKLKDVAKKDTFTYNNLKIVNDILEIFRDRKKILLSAYEEAGKAGKVDFNSGKLGLLKYTMKGYLSDLVEPESQLVFLDELSALTHKVGVQMIRPGDVGRQSVVIPFLDGRSDHNNRYPQECIRVWEDADRFKSHNVSAIFMTQAHSKKQIDYYENRDKNNVIRGSKVINLTQVNEYISILKKDMNINFEEFYVLAPDKGSVPDAFVLARELYRRVGSKFSGRVVVFHKKRLEAEKIDEVYFDSSYVYDRHMDKDEDFNLTDKKGHPVPFDMRYPNTYKNEDHDDFIGKRFKKEFEKEQLDELKNKIKGHRSAFADDIGNTLNTMKLVVEEAYKLFLSVSEGYIAHASLPGDAIKVLEELHEKGLLNTLVVSSSIYQKPFEEMRYVHNRTMADRDKTHMKDYHLDWMEINYQDIFQRLQ
ncbi:MAG: hypothetical protein ABH828_04340 [archaeon]